MLSNVAMESRRRSSHDAYHWSGRDAAATTDRAVIAASRRGVSASTSTSCPGGSGSVSEASVTLLDAVSFTISRRRAGRDRRAERRRQDDAAGGDRRHRPGDVGLGALRRHRRARQPGGVPQRARLRAPGRHHPRRPAARPHAALRGTAAASVVDERGRRRRRRRATRSTPSA